MSERISMNFDDNGYPKTEEMKCTTMPCSEYADAEWGRGNILVHILYRLMKDKFNNCSDSDLFVVNCMYDNGKYSRSVINYKTLVNASEHIVTHKVALMTINRITGEDSDKEVTYMYNRFTGRFEESASVSTIRELMIPTFVNKYKNIGVNQYDKIVRTHRIDSEDRQPVILASRPEERSNAPTKYAVFCVGNNVDFNPPVGTSIDFVTLENNGFTNEALLAIVIDRLEGFQSGEFPCDENATALEACKMALEALMNRTRDRRARNVENKHEI